MSNIIAEFPKCSMKYEVGAGNIHHADHGQANQPHLYVIQIISSTCHAVLISLDNIQYCKEFST
jgi:hypothetical protein